MPDYTFNKTAQIIACHIVIEGAPRDEWGTAYMNTHDNPTDLFTMVLHMSEKRQVFVIMLQNHIFGSF